MLIISTQTRAAVVIDGATYTVRPLTGAEKLGLLALESGRLMYGVRCGLTSIEGVVIDGKPATLAQVDHLPEKHLLSIASKVAELSNLSGDDSKNSTSRQASSPASSASSTANVILNGEDSNGEAPAAPPSTPSPTSSGAGVA